MNALVLAWMAVVVLGAWRWRPPPGRTLAPGNVGSDVTSRPPEPPSVRWPRWVGLAIVAAVVALVAWPPLGLAVVALAALRPRWSRARARRRQRLAVVRALPDVVDLLVVAIGAGLTPALAVDQMARLSPPPFADAFATVVRRVAHGQRLADALDALPERLGDPVRPMVRTLAGAERYGSPLAPALEVLGHEARRDRRRRAEEAARTLPIKLCFPLVCCTLPAFVLLTIAPLVAGALRSVRL